MGRNFYEDKDAELYTGSENFSTKISATPVPLGLTAALATQYATLNATWRSAYEEAVDPETRTRGKVAAKDQAKVNLKALASDLAKIIDGTPGVTDEQRIDLGLNVRAQRQSIPRPGVRPGTDIVSVTGRSVLVHIHDSASSAKRGKPAGVQSANLYSFVGATYPTDPAGWEYQGATTRASIQVIFPDDVPAGAQIWICATWVNAKSEAGPVSTPITTNLQGGLSMAG